LLAVGWDALKRTDEWSLEEDLIREFEEVIISEYVFSSCYLRAGTPTTDNGLESFNAGWKRRFGGGKRGVEDYLLKCMQEMSVEIGKGGCAPKIEARHWKAASTFMHFNLCALGALKVDDLLEWAVGEGMDVTDLIESLREGMDGCTSSDFVLYPSRAVLEKALLHIELEKGRGMWEKGKLSRSVVSYRSLQHAWETCERSVKTAAVKHLIWLMDIRAGGVQAAELPVEEGACDWKAFRAQVQSFYHVRAYPEEEANGRGWEAEFTYVCSCRDCLHYGFCHHTLHCVISEKRTREKKGLRVVEVPLKYDQREVHGSRRRKGRPKWVGDSFTMDASEEAPQRVWWTHEILDRIDTVPLSQAEDDSEAESDSDVEEGDAGGDLDGLGGTETYATLKWTETHEQVYNKGLNAKDMDEVVAVHRGAHLEVTRRDLQCMRPGELVNDEAMNLYMSLLNDRDSREGAATPGWLRCYFMNSFFHAKLKKDGYVGVERWSRADKLVGMDIHTYDRIIFPIHLTKYGLDHWTCAMVDVKGERICYLNSLKAEGSNDSTVPEALAEWYKSDRKEKKNEDVPVQDWPIEHWDCPQQSGATDCGVYVLKYCECLGRRQDSLPFSHEDMFEIRRRLAVEMLCGNIT